MNSIYFVVTLLVMWLPIGIVTRSLNTVTVSVAFADVPWRVTLKITRFVTPRLRRPPRLPFREAVGSSHRAKREWPHEQEARCRWAQFSRHRASHVGGRCAPRGLARGTKGIETF
jgi:hypothetical protein|eukprot:COSAG02_NODE_1231_length_13766_cov_16.546572_2_plen_115_part_00